MLSFLNRLKTLIQGPAAPDDRSVLNSRDRTVPEPHFQDPSLSTPALTVAPIVRGSPLIASPDSEVPEIPNDFQEALLGVIQHVFNEGEVLIASE
jgi:hypothetical protein